MGDIKKEDYERLGIQESLKYYDISVQRCDTMGCKNEGIEHTVNSSEPPFSFIYAKIAGKPNLRNVCSSGVCGECMVVRTILSEEYFRDDDADSQMFFAPKAKIDRGKDFYTDFSKQGIKDDPQAGQGATTLSKKDQQAWQKRLDNLGNN